MNKKKCEHQWERIGVTKDGIYSETEERCTKCGLIREIGTEDWIVEKKKKR